MIKIDNQLVTMETFPNGETKISSHVIEQILLKSRGEYHLTFVYENDASLIHLLMVKRFIDDNIRPNLFSRLRIAYMPYSRMDRTGGINVFTLKYVADLINGMNFDRVIVHEPHSDVTTALLDRSVACYDTFEILDSVEFEIGFDREKDFLFFPDAGAQKRYSHLTGYNIAVGNKKRDFETGRIIGLELSINSDKPVKDAKVIILDDLCSYGGTFIRSIDLLEKEGFGDVHLVVGHCEYGIYEGSRIDGEIVKLLEMESLKGTYTTNSIMQSIEDPKMHIYRIF
jgi:ribose-phosphate pyrophosphokinase